MTKDAKEDLMAILPELYILGCITKPEDRDISSGTEQVPITPYFS